MSKQLPENTTKPSISISFKLKTVKIVSLSIARVGDFKQIKLKKFLFKFGFKSNVLPKNNSIAIFTHVKIYDEAKKSDLLGEIETFNLFSIKNFKNIIIKENQRSRIPKFLLASMLGISISNTRGILIAKAAGTALENAVIPILNPTKMLEEMHK